MLPRTGYLSTPLSRAEQRHVAAMYREHRGLIRLMGRKMCRKYACVSTADIFSLIDTAFIKTCRGWAPEKGRFSTFLTVNCEGDIRHYIRDSNWLVKAPGEVRRVGQRARALLDRGHSLSEIRTELALSVEALRDALVATCPPGPILDVDSMQFAAPQPDDA